MAFNYLEAKKKKWFVSMVWSIQKKKDIRKTQRIGRTSIMMAPNLKDLPYEKRLLRLKLPTLE